MKYRLFWHNQSNKLNNTSTYLFLYFQFWFGLAQPQYLEMAPSKKGVSMNVIIGVYSSSDLKLLVLYYFWVVKHLAITYLMANFLFSWWKTLIVDLAVTSNCCQLCLWFQSTASVMSCGAPFYLQQELLNLGWFNCTHSSIFWMFIYQSFTLSSLVICRRSLLRASMLVWLWSWRVVNTASDTDRPWRPWEWARLSLSSLPTTLLHSGN